MPKSDDSVFDEPQFRAGGFAGDPTDPPLTDEPQQAAKPLPVGQGAWDEPALSRALAGDRPAHVKTYAQWLQEGVARWSAARSWGATIALAMVAGIWSVVGAILSQVQSNTAGGVLLIVAFGPVAEEMLKASAALITIEKWPYVFRSPSQILFCCIASALGFAALENLLYLNVYIHEPSPFIAGWRWTVCVALHVGGSTIVSLGLIKIWRQTMASHTPPRVSLGTPYFIAAAAFHGTYNFIAILINPVFAKL